MDMYGMSTPEHVFVIDDLLELSNEDLFFSTATDDSFNSAALARDPLPALLPDISFSYSMPASISPSTQFPANDSFLPPQSDNVAELEWLWGFVDDSLFHTPSSSVAGNLVDRPDTSFSGEHRAKRSRPVSSTAEGRLKETSVTAALGNAEGVARRCTHCASEKTPQWRMGPLGPKTLCNACGVRYKSGRLVPEYRPAASPTFVLTQHSNSHRKVMELRRQKELLRQEQLCRRQQ